MKQRYPEPTVGALIFNREGKALYDPETDQAFIEALKQNLPPSIKVIEVDSHINDESFAEQAVDILCEMMRNQN